MSDSNGHAVAEFIPQNSNPIIVEVGRREASGKSPVAASCYGKTHRDLFDVWDDRRRYIFAREALKTWGDANNPEAADDIDFIKREILLAADQAEEGPAGGAAALHYRKITSAALAAGDFRLDYLIPGVFVAKQPCIFGGPQKSLKTSIIIDLAVSLDLCGYFLGYFKVARRAAVGIMSGESGLGTLQETAKRICATAGCRLEDSGIVWSDELPRFGDPAHLVAIEEFIQGLDVLAIDPAYLAIPSGNEGSVFAQGELLRSVAEVCQRNNAALVLAHHLRKSRADNTAAPTLDEIAWSGFAEFARQWILVGRREPYDVGSGEHKLWLSVGGSAGHNGLYGVDVNEGKQNDDGGRRWQVDVRGVQDTAAEAEKAKEKREAEKRAGVDQRNEQKLRDAIRRFPQGETSKVLRTAASLSGESFATAIRSLLVADRAEACQITKGKREYDGFRPTKNT